MKFEGLVKQLGGHWVYEYEAQVRDLGWFNGYRRHHYTGYHFKLSSITLFHFKKIYTHMLVHMN